MSAEVSKKMRDEGVLGDIANSSPALFRQIVGDVQATESVDTGKLMRKEIVERFGIVIENIKNTPMKDLAAAEGNGSNDADLLIEARG